MTAQSEGISDDFVAIGKDVTGQGTPNLVISQWSGGAHCCLNVDVFEIGDTFRKIATLDAQDNDFAHFEKRGIKKELVFVMYDLATLSKFGDYWCYKDFMQPPATRVILRYTDGKYRLAVDLMRKPAPSPKEITSMITEVQNSWDEECSPPTPKKLWAMMMDLIYSGNANAAWKLFDKAWMLGTPGKAEALKEFRSQLDDSAYSNEIKLLNQISVQ